MTDITPTQLVHRVADTLDRLDRKCADARRNLGVLRLSVGTSAASAEFSLAGLRRALNDVQDLARDMADAAGRTRSAA